MVNVVHYVRKTNDSRFSIERLYEDVREYLSKDIDVVVWKCAEFSKGFLPRVRDILRARRVQSEVNHVTGDVHYLTFLLDRRRTILTIHDLVLLERLSGIKRWLAWLLWYWLPVKRSRLVITVSHATRDALLRSVRCNPQKVRVICNPVSKEFQPSPYTFNASRPRILQIGTGANKNVERLAAALEGISAHLTVIGPLSNDQIDILRGNGTDFENLVGLSRDELVVEYRRADMLVFASTYEGFGLPIIEAQAIGRPVVTSNIGPMPEVAGLGACLVDPFDVASLRAGILRVIIDDRYRSQLIDYGFQNIEKYSAQLVSREYADVYREIRNSVNI